MIEEYLKETNVVTKFRTRNYTKNSDNFFLAIHSSYKNAGHLLNSFVAEYCDLNRRLLRTEPREGDPFFTIVCEFRKSNLRK